jgi:hypothetical protein
MHVEFFFSNFQMLYPGLHVSGTAESERRGMMMVLLTFKTQLGEPVSNAPQDMPIIHGRQIGKLFVLT